MKKLITVAFICCLFLGYINIANGQNVSQTSKAKIEKEVDSIFLVMVHASERFDLSKLAGAVDDKHKAGFLINGNYYDQFETLMDNLKSIVQSGAKQTITIQKKNISVITDKIVLLAATGNALVETNDGNQRNLNFFWSFVYEKINNEWKVIQSHQSGK